MTNTNEMTPFENDDLRGIIFSYLRTPCEYKKPSHYEVMKPFCFGVQHEEFHPLNPLCNIHSEIRDIDDLDGWTIGDCIDFEGTKEHEDIEYYQGYSIDVFRDSYC
tara:strand:- start:374 stop:691 length:318 start_codon:yes stop_codon:yes gene_type:complete